jgi:hypothetical protein
MKPRLPLDPVTDARLDAALKAEDDQILPSSGFADAVMIAVHAQAADPAPIPFPWKRAVPGLVGAAACFALLVAVLIEVVSVFLHSGRASSSHAAGIFSGDKLDLAPLLHSLAAPNVAWIALAVLIPIVCFVALRRLIFSR